MRGFSNKRSSKNRIKKYCRILFVVIVLFIFVYAADKLYFIPAPVVEGIDAFTSLPVEKTVTLSTRNLKFLNIFINQDIRKIELVRDFSDGDEKTYTIQIKPKELGLSNGPARVVIKAESGILKKIDYEINAMVDTVPPSLEIINAPSVVDQGSGGFALLRAEDAESVTVKLGGYSFKGFKAPSVSGRDAAAAPGSRDRPSSTYFVFFPAPIDIKGDSVFYAVAEDSAGNRVIKTLPTRLKTKRFKRSSMNISDSFINKVVLPLLDKTDIQDPVSAFKEVNEQQRAKSAKRLIEIAGKTGPEILWKGPFLQLKNSKVMAGYGDKRTYLYKGKKISRSIHLGYDLASLANAPVEASNTGIVMFAGDLGIYGNAVIIDHGLGLMSLYGHLSSITVEEGRKIKKGEIIGRTGSTGLAGGDHLHFSILLHGYQVSPLYWWDSHWIKVNLTDNFNP